MQKTTTYTELDEMLNYVNNCNGYGIRGKIIDSSRLVFEERVKMNCFYCGKYNTSWKCPPRIPQIDYKKMLSEFEKAAFIYLKSPLVEGDYNTVRNESSVKLHRSLLLCEKWLWDNNNSTALSFIGGSCKLCKNGCASDRCANPYQARTPVEALGINVVKSAEIFGIDISFPLLEYMLRIGMLLW